MTDNNEINELLSALDNEENNTIINLTTSKIKNASIYKSYNLQKKIKNFHKIKEYDIVRILKMFSLAVY